MCSVHGDCTRGCVSRSCEQLRVTGLAEPSPGHGNSCGSPEGSRPPPPLAALSCSLSTLSSRLPQSHVLKVLELSPPPSAPLPPSRLCAVWAQGWVLEGEDLSLVPCPPQRAHSSRKTHSHTFRTQHKRGDLGDPGLPRCPWTPWPAAPSPRSRTCGDKKTATPVHKGLFREPPMLRYHDRGT